MIILEGPDGGGKTTLLNQLRNQYRHTLAVHERASDSKSGPVPDLFEWAERDVTTWSEQPLSLYDRHPLISEYIYGLIVRGGTMDPRFFTTPLRRHLARRALVIVCVPPLGAVRRAVSAERDAPGVATHIDAIWASYASLRATWPCSTGLVHYDYTNTSIANWSNVIAYVNHHITRWEYKHD